MSWSQQCNQLGRKNNLRIMFDKTFDFSSDYYDFIDFIACLVVHDITTCFTHTPHRYAEFRLALSRRGYHFSTPRAGARASSVRCHIALLP